MPQSIVEVAGLSKVFTDTGGDEVAALANISVQWADGEFAAILGPSGCGKTTLLRIIAGHENPSIGSVRIDGRDVTGAPPNKRPVNMVFQTPALFPHMSVFENIAFGLRMAGSPRGEFKTRVLEALALVRLEGYEGRRPDQLSGGQAHRVALARALVNRPRVLLLDEPLSALDLNLRKAMQLELRAIHRQLGTTFLYVTHDQEEAVTLAERILLMNQGTIVQDGSPNDLYEHPKTLFASQFIGEMNVWRVKSMQTSPTRALIVDAEGIRVELNSSTVQNDARWFVIRPEHIDIGRDRPKKRNTYEGRVVDAIVKGPLVLYEINLPTGPKAFVVRTFNGAASILDAGSAVWIGWNSDRGLLLPD